MAAQPIVHVEIPASDPKAASKFYADAFGWQIHVAPEFDYHMFQAEGGPGGGFVSTSSSEGGMQSQPGDVLIYIGREDIEADLRKVQELGGSVVVPKMEIPQTGWFGIFQDPTGNKVALYTPMQSQG